MWARVFALVPHELVGLGEVYPAHFGQFLLVANKSLGSVSWVGGQVDHLAPGMGVDAAYDTRRTHPQARLFFDFAHRRDR
jgi:hypothetical protein